MWKKGLCFLFLAGVSFAQPNPSDDPFDCANYVEWFGAETQLSQIRYTLLSPNLNALRRANLQRRESRLAAKVAYYRSALMTEDTASPWAAPRPPLAQPKGGDLEPTPPITLEHYFHSRPQTQDVLEGGTRRLVLSGNGQALIVIGGSSHRALIWDLKIRKYYTLTLNQNIVDAEIDWNGNAVILDAGGTMSVHSLPTGTRVPSKAQLVKTRAMALSDFNLLSLNDVLLHSRAGTYGDFKRLDHPFTGKERRLRVTRDLKFAAVVTEINTVRVFHLDSGKEIPMPAPNFNGNIIDLQFAPDAHQFVALTDRGQLIKWSARAPARYEMFAIQELEVTGLAVGAGKQVIVAGNAFGGLEGMLVAVDIESGEEAARYRTEQEGGISAVTLSLDGSLIVTAGVEKGLFAIYRNPAYLAH